MPIRPRRIPIAAADGGEKPVLRSVVTILRTAPRPVWILVAGVLVNRMGSYFATFATLFLTSRAIPLASLPVILAAIAAAGMLGSLAGGWIADRFSRRAALVSSAAASAVSLACVALAPTRPTVIAAVCLSGFCTQSYVPAASALLVDFSRPEERVPLFALFRLALNVGAAIAGLTAGLIAAHSYGALFVVDAVTSAAFAIVILVGLPRPPPGPRPTAGAREADEADGGASDPGDADPGEADAARPGRRDRAGQTITLPLMLSAFFCVAAVYAQHTATLPLHLAAAGHTPRLFGALLALNAVIVIAAELPISSLTRRRSPRVPLGLGAGLIAAGMAGCLASGATVVVAGGVLVWTFGEMLLAPVAGNAMADIAPDGRIARYQSYLVAAQTLGFALGPAAGALIYAHASSALPLVCLIGGFTAVALIVMAARLSTEKAGSRCRR
jgi:MFS family permease